MAPVDRQTVDLSEYPDLVVIYLGMRVNRLRGLRRFFGLGPQIDAAAKRLPTGSSSTRRVFAARAKRPSR